MSPDTTTPEPAPLLAVPAATERLRFRAMTAADLDDEAAMLGDPAVMTYYPAPKTREEAVRWIAWTQYNYTEHGFGLWVIETHGGEFVGDCGLTWQSVNGTLKIEVGYHVRTAMQGRGYATEAAASCRDFARDHLRTSELVAIIHPLNAASIRVAEKLGMSHVDDELHGDLPVRTVMGMPLRP